MKRSRKPEKEKHSSASTTSTVATTTAINDPTDILTVISDLNATDSTSIDDVIESSDTQANETSIFLDRHDVGSNSESPPAEANSTDSDPLAQQIVSPSAFTSELLQLILPDEVESVSSSQTDPTKNALIQPGRKEMSVLEVG